MSRLQQRLDTSQLISAFLIPQFLIAIFITWAVCGILTMSGTLPEGSAARTDLTMPMVARAPWFYVPYPGKRKGFVRLKAFTLYVRVSLYNFFFFVQGRDISSLMNSAEDLSIVTPLSCEQLMISRCASLMCKHDRVFRQTKVALASRIMGFHPFVPSYLVNAIALDSFLCLFSATHLSLERRR